MIKKVQFIILLLGLTTHILSAPKNIDSLKLELEKIPEDSAFLIYINLSNLYGKYRNNDSAIYYGQKAMDISKAQNHRLTLAHRNLGYVYGLSGDEEMARKLMYQGIKWAAKEKDSVNLCWIYTQLGGLYADITVTDSSLYYCMKALDLATLPKQETINRRNIALSYFYQGNIEKAIENQKEILNLPYDYSDSERIGFCGNLAGFYYYAKKYDSAAYYYKRVYDLYEAEGLDHSRLRVLGNIASIEYAKGNYREAIRINKDIIRQSRLLNLDDQSRDASYYNIAVNNRMLGHLDEASLYLDSAETLYLRYKKERDETKVLNERILLDSLRGDQEAMVATLKRQIFFNDSVRKERNDRQLAELQTQFETEKKDQEIESLSQQAAIQSLEISKQRNQLVIGALVAVVLVMGGFIFYRQEKVRKERSAAELEQRFLRSQLNPHFIFNSMTAIQQYLEENEPEGASHYMGMFSTLMRQILENSRQEFISLAEEVSMLENYLQLQQMRFRDQFEYEIEIDEDLDEDYAGVPPMFAQPFIENSLEHGLFRKDGQKNRIRIHFEKIGDSLVGLEIEDSGVGVEESKVVVDHKSLATKITNERLSKLRAFANKKVGMESQNILNEAGDIHGYRINLRLPTQLVSV